jgi:ubiquinone/menaquinone biosynthesis C-methylase UbiE
MSLVARAHERLVASRRVRVLGSHLARRIEPGSRVLDVGCGDGALDAWLAREVPGIEIRGVDVVVRPASHVPVEPFDGRQLPFPELSFDIVMMVDVLHHAEDPLALLRESARVARRGVLLKDHNREGFLAFPTLCLMDIVGNAYRGALHRFRYWNAAQWREAFSNAGLIVESREGRLGLYPPLADRVFGRRLHFVALLRKA